MRFGDKIKELRDKAGLTQEALARRANTSVSNIRNYEQSHRGPYWHGLFPLAAALGVDVNEFAQCEEVQEAMRPLGIVVTPAEVETPPAKKTIKKRKEK
jgi:transcriptional regulator with XRE-family HTH domain